MPIRLLKSKLTITIRKRRIKKVLLDLPTTIRRKTSLLRMFRNLLKLNLRKLKNLRRKRLSRSRLRKKLRKKPKPNKTRKLNLLRRKPRLKTLRIRRLIPPELSPLRRRRPMRK